MKSVKNIVRSVSVILPVSLFFLIFSYIYSSVKTSSLKDLSEDKKLYEQAREEYSGIRASMKDWENIETEYLEFKDKYMMRFEDFSAFRQDLESIIRRNSLSKIKFRIEYKRALKNEFIKVAINLKLAGRYENLKKFIHEIIGLDKMVFFQLIKMTGASPSIAADLNMEVYLVK